MIFLRFFYESCQKQQFYDVFLRVGITKYCKLHAYMRERGPRTGANAFDSALQIDRENPFSVNTDWGKRRMIVLGGQLAKQYP